MTRLRLSSGGLTTIAALLAAVQNFNGKPGRDYEREQQKPGAAPLKKFSGVTRRAKVCVADCFTQNVDLPDGGIAKEVVHSVRCPVALAIFNQGVNTRQVRRYYARIMAKKGGVE